MMLDSYYSYKKCEKVAYGKHKFFDTINKKTDIFRKTIKELFILFPSGFLQFPPKPSNSLRQVLTNQKKKDSKIKNSSFRLKSLKKV